MPKKSQINEYSDSRKLENLNALSTTLHPFLLTETEIAATCSVLIVSAIFHILSITKREIPLFLG